MKRRKRFQVRCVLILILSLLLTACESGKSSEKKEEDKKKENVSEAGEVSKEAQAVIETMMTAPNPDLLFTPSVIGEGVEEEVGPILRKGSWRTFFLPAPHWFTFWRQKMMGLTSR